MDKDIIISLDSKRELLLRRKRLDVFVYKKIININHAENCYLYSRKNKNIFGFLKNVELKREKRVKLYSYETGYNNSELNLRLTGQDEIMLIVIQYPLYKFKNTISLEKDYKFLYDIPVPKGIARVDKDNQILMKHTNELVG